MRGDRTFRILRQNLVGVEVNLNQSVGWLRMPSERGFSRFFMFFLDHRLMSIERAEQLKKELTDKWVVVTSGIPELRRFQALTGRVKTVNMNCRALVEFDGPEDIGWYDIDPGCLTVVDGPKHKEKPAAAEKAEAKAPAAKPSSTATGGSPLDKIRSQSGGAAPASKPAGGGAAKPAAPASGGSPLDKIRAQSGSAPTPAAAPVATPESPAAPEEPVAETPPPAPPAGGSVDTAGMSPLDAIRAQGGFKGDK